MDTAKRQKLEAAGWKVGSTADFLELTSEESALIEMKLALAKKVKELRKMQNISQKSLAESMGSSQSRVAKMEAGDPSVSIDLLVSGLVYVGATKEVIAEAISSSGNSCTAQDRNCVPV